MLADLFVADLADAPSYEEQMGPDVPTERFEVRSFGDFTQLELEILWALIERQEWSPERHTLEPVTPPEESWLFAFPQPFVELLARLPAAEVGPIAASWSQIEELSCSAEEIQPVVESLVELARLSKESGRGLFLWGSL